MGFFRSGLYLTLRSILLLVTAALIAYLHEFMDY